MQTFLNAIQQKLFEGTKYYATIVVIVNQSKILQSEFNEIILKRFQLNKKLPYNPQVFTVDASNISTTDERLPELQNKDPNKSMYKLLIITNINNTPIDTNNQSINIVERKKLNYVGPIKILATMHSPQQNDEAVEEKITQIFGQNVLNQNIMYTSNFLLEEDVVPLEILPNSIAQEKIKNFLELVFKDQEQQQTYLNNDSCDDLWSYKINTELKIEEEKNLLGNVSNLAEIIEDATNNIFITGDPYLIRRLNICCKPVQIKLQQKPLIKCIFLDNKIMINHTNIDNYIVNKIAEYSAKNTKTSKHIFGTDFSEKNILRILNLISIIVFVQNVDNDSILQPWMFSNQKFLTVISSSGEPLKKDWGMKIQIKLPSKKTPINFTAIIDIVLMLIIGIVTVMNIVLLSWLYSPNVSPKIKKKLKTISYSVIFTSAFSIIFCGIFYYRNHEIKYKQIIAVIVGLIHSVFIGFAVYLLATNHKK